MLSNSLIFRFGSKIHRFELEDMLKAAHRQRLHSEKNSILEYFSIGQNSFQVLSNPNQIVGIQNTRNAKKNESQTMHSSSSNSAAKFCSPTNSSAARRASRWFSQTKPVNLCSSEPAEESWLSTSLIGLETVYGKSFATGTSKSGGFYVAVFSVMLRSSGGAISIANWSI